MTPHWVIAIIAFMGPAPVDSKFLGPIDTKERCEIARDKAVQAVQDAGFEVWAACMEVKAAERKRPAIKSAPETEQKS